MAADYRKPAILGRDTSYPGHYAPELLDPLPRRRIAGAAFGEDIWNHYELSWLDAAGYPCAGILCARIGCDSENLIESKSLKLYFNSLNQTRFDSTAALLQTVSGDLDKAACGRWTLALDHPVSSALASESSDAGASTEESGNFVDRSTWLAGEVVDTLADSIDIRQRELLSEVCAGNTDRCELLVSEAAGQYTSRQILTSHLLKSNCPVTGQPDWASLLVINGPGSNYRLKPESLLNYIASYRQHEGFHEQCVESIYADISARLGHEAPLLVYARYTRRGGIDINPWRSNRPATVRNVRLSRQ